MKIQNYSYHTHTTYSDGKSSLEEMIVQAIKLGWSEIGISDHLIIHKDINNTRNLTEVSNGIHKFYYETFEAAKRNCAQRIKEIREVATNYPIKVLVGFEADYFAYDGWVEGFKGFLQGLDLDYIHSGNHFLVHDNVLINSVHPSIDLSDKALQKKLISEHFNNIRLAIKSGLFDFIAHLDFMRWSKMVGESDYKDERMAIIEALGHNHTPYELNSKGYKSIGEQYPARWMLEELKKRDVPIVINDDAHHANDLGQYFDRAEALLQELNYTNRWKLKNND